MNEFNDIGGGAPVVKKERDLPFGRVRIDPSSRSVDHGQKTSAEADRALSLVRSSGSDKDIEALVEDIRLENRKARVRFDMEANGHVVLNIVDPTTNNVIQRIPPKNVFDTLAEQGLIKLKSFLVDVKR